MTKLFALLKLARVKQWVKNLVVFTALIFSGRLTDPSAAWMSLKVFICFCLASAGVYFLNDFRDLEEDRLHPEKSKRPLASGQLPPIVGPIGFVLCSIGALTTGFFSLNIVTGIVVSIYMALNLGYSLGLKHLVIIDVLLIASGFVLRILAGATAIAVMPSEWLVLCAVTGSLFMGFAKRRAEVVLLGDKSKNHRKVLAQYSVSFLDQMISIVTAATIVCYILYTVDDRTADLVGSRMLVFSVPFVLFGIFRYLYLVYHSESGGDPAKTLITDLPIVTTVLLWAVFCGVAILFGENILKAIS